MSDRKREKARDPLKRLGDGRSGNAYGSGEEDLPSFGSPRINELPRPASVRKTLRGANRHSESNPAVSTDPAPRAKREKSGRRRKNGRKK